MKIFVDLFDRIGSSNMSKRYRSLLLSHIDAKKKYTQYHGADGKSNFSFSSTSILNYRKKEAWDLLIDEAITFVKNYGVDGLHIDNCSLWPTLKRINKTEMYRHDSDGEPCYSNLDILNGEVVNPEKDNFLWTDCTDSPNPILVKLMKELWKNFPSLIVIGECCQEDSQTVIKNSGVIPRSHTTNDLYSARNPIENMDKSYLSKIDNLFFQDLLPVTMHDEIEGIDSEIGFYIQYFDYNFREKHAVIKRTSDPFKELLSEVEDTKTEESSEETTRKEFSKLVSNRFELARKMRKNKSCLKYGKQIYLR